MRSPFGFMETSSPLREPIFSMTEPSESCGTSAIMRSIGSHLTPSISFIMALGAPTWNS